MQESETQWLLPAKGEHVRARREEPSLVQDVPRVRSRVFMANSHTVSVHMDLLEEALAS